MYFRLLSPAPYVNGLLVTVYKDSAGMLSPLVKVAQAQGAENVFYDDPSAADGDAVAFASLRVSFRVQPGGIYAIQVDAETNRAGPFHVNWKYGAGAAPDAMVTGCGHVLT